VSQHPPGMGSILILAAVMLGLLALAAVVAAVTR
jgi:hypothetical protein